ncbi:MAG: hypothetical protein ACI9EF_003738 [Pseudohongiellaceae bacterium]|jgi:uncharacterized protein YgiM (DUF1202 family)
MEALLIMLALVAQTTAPLPADAFAQSNDPLVLRAGPSDSHAGVLSVPGGTVLRVVSEGTGAYQQVHLAKGFPIYLHGDFVQVDELQKTARVQGQRVNARLLPSTVGLLPVGRVGADAGELVLLGIEGDWVRVVAPVELALLAQRSALTTVSASIAADAWGRDWQSRAAGREARVAEALTTDPEWLAQHDAALELGFESRVEVPALNDAKLSFRARELAELGRRLGDGSDVRGRWQTLVNNVSREQRRRKDAVEAHAASLAERALADKNLLVESRALALGLAYQGQGQSQRIEGTVRRLTSADSEGVVFAISEGSREFKLSAPAGVTELALLEGRTVILEGRSLLLMNVEGTVLIVDRVVNSGR